MCFSILPYAKIQNFASDCKCFPIYFANRLTNNALYALKINRRRRRKSKTILRKNDDDGGDAFSFFLSSSFFSLVLVLCS